MSRMIEVETPLEAVLVERALMMARELQAVADAAPDGQVLARAELAALRCGRELIRRALEASLQQQADAVEKKVGRDARASAGVAATPKGRPRKPR